MLKDIKISRVHISKYLLQGLSNFGLYSYPIYALEHVIFSDCACVCGMCDIINAPIKREAIKRRFIIRADFLSVLYDDGFLKVICDIYLYFRNYKK